MISEKIEEPDLNNLWLAKFDSPKIVSGSIFPVKILLVHKVFIFFIKEGLWINVFIDFTNKKNEYNLNYPF